MCESIMSIYKKQTDKILPEYMRKVGAQRQFCRAPEEYVCYLEDV